MKVIGIAGYARAGKDTFVGIAKELLIANGFRPTRLAFADKLKEEAEAMLVSNQFKASVKTTDPTIKTQMRPLMVWWGCQRRYESDGGLYWVNEVDKQIENLEKCEAYGGHMGSGVILVSDVRFPNEAKWVHEKWGGSVIHLKRFSNNWRKGGQDGSDEFLVKEYDAAPNEEEAKQDPMVEAMADVHAEWENQKASSTEEAIKMEKLKGTVLAALNQTKFFKLPEPIVGTLHL